eukprot:3633876-Rhodomonas_salina.1
MSHVQIAYLNVETDYVSRAPAGTRAELGASTRKRPPRHRPPDPSGISRVPRADLERTWSGPRADLERT